MAAVGEPFPVKVFLKMLGLPVERMPEYRALVKEILTISDAEPEKAVEVSMRITASMRETILERRDNPRRDIISLLWGTRIEDRPTTLAEMENYGVLLFIAGMDTVTNGIGHGVRHLAEDQALQTKLRDDPSLIPEATEELLRRYSFASAKRRIKKDTVFQGAPMKAGESVMLLNPAANLDSREFPEADKFDLHREKKTHITFNAGPHRCLGSHLARLELQTVYEELLARLPPFRLDAANPPAYRCGWVVGLDTLHLKWDHCR